jgi:hypothetical protein
MGCLTRSPYNFKLKFHVRTIRYLYYLQLCSPCMQASLVSPSPSSTQSTVPTGLDRRRVELVRDLESPTRRALGRLYRAVSEINNSKTRPEMENVNLVEDPGYLIDDYSALSTLSVTMSQNGNSKGLCTVCQSPWLVVCSARSRHRVSSTSHEVHTDYVVQIMAWVETVLWSSPTGVQADTWLLTRVRQQPVTQHPKLPEFSSNNSARISRGSRRCLTPTTKKI